MSARDELLEYADRYGYAEHVKLIDAYRAEVLAEEATELRAACPDHGQREEVWMDCPCRIADELERRATTEATS
jgi:hypothetical protein